jgi:hypothetical protein
MSLADHNAALAPKVQGSWNLHQYFASQDDLDFYIMLSSLIGVVGFASQSNYSAGGAFQDALARHRVEHGLPGVSIDLGIVKSVGYLAEDEASKTIDTLQRHGFTTLSEDDVLSAIGSAIHTPYAGQLALGLNTGPTTNHGENSPLNLDRRFASLTHQATPAETGSPNTTNPQTTNSASDLATLLTTSSPTLAAATSHIMAALARKLTDIFMLADDGGDVVPDRALADYGVDSLVAVELRNMVALKAGADMSIFEIMQSGSVRDLAGRVAVKSRFVSV